MIKQQQSMLTVLGTLLAAAMLLIVAGCGGKSTPPVATPVPPTATAVPPTATASPPTPSVPLPETDESWSRIQAAGRIIVGTSADYPPFEYYRDFQLDGFDIALMQEVAQRLGVEVEFHDMAFADLTNALLLDQVDVVVAALSVTPEREEVLAFGNVYYVGQDAIVAARDASFVVNSVADMAGRRVGAQRGSVYEKWLQTSLVDAGLTPQQNLFAYLRVEDALPDLAGGRVDLVVLDRVPAQVAAESQPVKVVGQGLNPQRYAMAMRPGEVALQAELNRALQDIQNAGGLAALVEEYLDLDPAAQLPLPTPEPPTPMPEVIQPTPTPGCVNGMTYVQDLSYDDRGMTAPSMLQPGEQFMKSWRVRNSGTCPWDGSYGLYPVGGNQPAAQMNGSAVSVQGRVMPGETYDFQVNLVAPQAPGVYQGLWQMRSNATGPFGPRIWVGVQVPAPATATPAPTQTPVAGIQFSVDRVNITRGECVTFQWNVTNVSEVYFYEEGGTWQNNGVPGQAQRQACPDQTKSYYLRVIKRDGAVETREIRIQVERPIEGPRITVFSVNPQGQILLGQCVNVSWDVQGDLSRVAIRRNSTDVWDNAPARANIQDCPPGTGAMQYTIEANGPGGSSRASQVIQVVAPPTATPVPPTPVPPTPTPVPPTPTPVPPTPTPLPPPTPVQPLPDPAADLRGKDWQMTSYFDGSLIAPKLPGTTVTLRFGFDELTGSAGCNTFSGTYTTPGAGLLTIGPLIAGQTTCGDPAGIMEQEYAFLQALQRSVAFTFDGGRLHLRDSANTIVLEFVE